CLAAIRHMHHAGAGHVHFDAALRAAAAAGRGAFLYIRSRGWAECLIMFQKPTVAEFRHAAQKIGMNPNEAYLNAVEQIITPLANAYATLDTTPDDLPAVKYPRGQFYRPSAEENPHGAWYMKTSIKGKPGGKLAGRRVALKDNVCLAG